MVAATLTLLVPTAMPGQPGSGAGGCASAFKQGAVCDAANRRAIEIMRAGNLHAITVVQDVRAGYLAAFAASDPGMLDVATPVLPLSLTKLMLAASWWDNRQPDSSLRVTGHEMLVDGSDSAGREMAIALRASVGAAAVLRDFKRYGFPARTDAPVENGFWAELAPAWRVRLMPPPAWTLLRAGMKDADWADTLSIGESNVSVTALHISRFLQAVGNDGLMISPSAREERAGPSDRRPTKAVRAMRKETALRLQSAMRDAVQRGTASSIATALAGTGWQMGGKTGTGPGPDPISPESDGWFAGLIFDPRGQARFTVATFVKHGGKGGGNAARVSAEMARFLIAENGAINR